MSKTQTESSDQDLTGSNWLEIIRQRVSSLRYGVVEIVVHDSRVTQIDKTERIRLDKLPGEKTPSESNKTK